MTTEQYNELVDKLGKEAADKIKEQGLAIEKKLNDKYEELAKGQIKKEEFEEFKNQVINTELKTINDKLAEIKDAAVEQGKVINTLKENAAAGPQPKKTLEQFLGEAFKVDADGKVTSLKTLRDSRRDFITITGEELKAAGVTSIGNSIQDMTSPPGSPYAPGIGGAELELFDIVRNPNYILNHVDVGRTNQSRLAWINETDYQGTPGTSVSEGGAKPLTQHKFQVEYSTAKKAAAYIELTDEFDTDLPGLATAVRRMLQDDVIRAFDDKIQTDVIAVAHSYDITDLDGEIQDANLWSALRAMMGQVASYNFMSNTVGINPLTSVMLDESKNANGTYLLPPFAQSLRSMIVEANKVAFEYAFVGDLKQYKVDLYKDLTLIVGWINDNVINNKFVIVAELRYHSYISDTRKKAICYDNINDVKDQINSGS